MVRGTVTGQTLPQTSPKKATAAGSRSAIQEELDAIRKQGVAQDRKEKLKDAKGILRTPEEEQALLRLIYAKKKRQEMVRLPPPKSTSSTYEWDAWHKQQRAAALAEKRQKQEAQNILRQFRGSLRGTEKFLPSKVGKGDDGAQNINHEEDVEAELEELAKSLMEKAGIELDGKTLKEAVASGVLSEKEENENEGEAEAEAEAWKKVEEDVGEKAETEAVEEEGVEKEEDEKGQSEDKVETETEADTVEEEKVEKGEEKKDEGKAEAETAKDEKIENEEEKSEAVGETDSTKTDAETAVEEKDKAEADEEDEAERDAVAEKVEQEVEEVEKGLEMDAVEMLRAEAEEEVEQGEEEKSETEIEQKAVEADAEAISEVEVKGAAEEKIELDTANKDEQQQPEDGDIKSPTAKETQADINTDESQSTPIKATDTEVAETAKKIEGRAVTDQQDEPLETPNSTTDVCSNGEAKTSVSYAHRGVISTEEDSKFLPGAGRYVLYTSPACPLGHQALLVIALKGLQDTISVTSAQPLWEKTKPEDTEDHLGWVFTTSQSFDDDDDEVAYSSGSAETVENVYSVQELYEQANDTSGNYTLPLLWDKASNTIVNNDPSDIVRILNSEFNEFASQPLLDLYPPTLQKQIDSMNDWMCPDFNHGVYECGLAKTHSSYVNAAMKVTKAMEKIESILQDHHYLIGDCLTLADLRLFTTLLRFDEVYSLLCKMNTKSVAGSPTLLKYCRNFYHIRGVAETCDMDQIKTYYYCSWGKDVNPHGIIPLGPGFISLL